MKHWLFPPQAEERYDEFAQSVLHYTLLLLLAIVVISLPFVMSPIAATFSLSTLALLLISYILLHTGRAWLANIIFLVGVWVVITVAAVSLNGIRNAGVASYTIVIVYSAILFPGRTVIGFTLLSVLSAGILLVGELEGVLPLARTELFIGDRFFQNAALFLTSGGLLWLAARTLQRNVDELRHNETVLKERNKQLVSEIQERRRAEAELRASEEKYRILFDNTQVIASVHDAEDRTTLINAAAAEVLGRSQEELLGKSVFDMLPEAEARGAYERHRRVRETGQAETVEGHVTLPNGRSVYYVRQVVPLPESPANPGSREVLTLTMDVTAQKLAEEQATALKLADEKNAFLTEFFGTISHDLKTPLTVLNTTLYLLERARTEDQRTQTLNRMKDNVQVLQDYIQDMLTYARLEHLPTFGREAVDVIALLERVIERLRPRAEKKSIRIETDFAPDMLPILGSDDHLQRAFVNLVENAITYTPDGGRVALTTRQQGEQAAIAVSDTGVGIAPDDLEQIFGRFFRGDAAREMESSGSGLGLAIVKKVVDMHEGDIQVESTPGQGTTFTVKLPGTQE